MKTYKFKINGNEYNVDINSVEGNIADSRLQGFQKTVSRRNGPSSCTPEAGYMPAQENGGHWSRPYPKKNYPIPCLRNGLWHP